MKEQVPDARDSNPLLRAENHPLPSGNSGQGLLHHHTCEDPSAHPDVHPQPAQRKGGLGRSRSERRSSRWSGAIQINFNFPTFSVVGKCLRSLHAESLRLLFVVPGEVSRLLKSGECLWISQVEALESNRGKAFTVSRSFQNAYTATAINSTSFCTSARDAFIILVENALRVTAINTVGDFVLFLGKVPGNRHQTPEPLTLLDRASLLTLPSSLSGAHRLLHGVLRRAGPELPEALHGVGAAAPHRVRLCVPGGALLPVGLWERGGRPLPLLCHWQQVQRRQPRTRVLHGQDLDGERLGVQRCSWSCPLVVGGLQSSFLFCFFCGEADHWPRSRNPEDIKINWNERLNNRSIIDSYLFQEYVENSKKMGRYKPKDGEGREMSPMVSWNILDKLPFLLSVL